MKQPAPGITIADRYCLERPLASGGMGSVWIARHVQLEVDVAIKFMGVELTSSAESRTRFEREAKAAAHLKSPYVVHVQDYGVDSGLPYIVMELLQGEDLEDRLRHRGRLSLHETMQFLSQAAKALGRAHELGIVHRDLKPRNLFIANMHDEEIIKILDFGIAKKIGAFGAAGATTSQVMGTPHYMSPEQIRGVKDIDHRSDLWSLGVILFKTVTGTLPFHGEVLIDVLNRVISGPIPAPTELLHGLPVALDDFFQRALNRDREQRFQSAREMADAFAEITRTSAMPRQSNPSVPEIIQTAPAFTQTPSVPLLLSRRAEPISATLPLKPPEPLTTVTETVPKSAVLDSSASQRPSRFKPTGVVLFVTALFLAAGAMFVVVMQIKSPHEEVASPATPATATLPTISPEHPSLPQPSVAPAPAGQSPAEAANPATTSSAAPAGNSTASQLTPELPSGTGATGDPKSSGAADKAAPSASEKAKGPKTPKPPAPKRPATNGADDPSNWGF